MKKLPEITEIELTPRVTELLSHHHTKQLVRRYFNPQDNEIFAGNTFHTLGTNDPNRFGNDDLLSLNLLDESVTAPQIREITSGKYDDLLMHIDPRADITQLDGDLFFEADQLYRTLRRIHGFGPTRVSKLLARKRPKLLPIRDSIVNEKLQISGFAWWKSLAATMRQDSVIELLDETTPPTEEGSPARLRVLDAAIWMHGSKSKAVKKVWTELEKIEK